MTKEMLKGLIELVSEEDIETLYNVVVKFIPENVPLPDEIEAIERADKSIAKNVVKSFLMCYIENRKGSQRSGYPLSNELLTFI